MSSSGPLKTVDDDDRAPSRETAVRLKFVRDVGGDWMKIGLCDVPWERPGERMSSKSPKCLFTYHVLYFYKRYVMNKRYIKSYSFKLYKHEFKAM